MRAASFLMELIRSIEDISLFLIFVLMFLIGGYGVYDSYMIQMSANDTYVLRFKPGYESNEEESKDTRTIVKKDMAAWLTIDDTSIDYPVMQGDTNDEYINKDCYGDYALAGAIFVDSRNARDFTDPYSIIYGHHMAAGAMFGALDAFREKKYFDAHKKGSLYVGELIYDIELVAMIEVDATNPYIFAPDAMAPEEIAKFIKKESFWYEEPAAGDIEGLNIISLTTCKYPNTLDRTAVIGVITNPHKQEAQ